MSSGEACALVRERGKVLYLALLLSLCSVARCYEWKSSRWTTNDQIGRRTIMNPVPLGSMKRKAGSALSAAMYSSRIILLSSG